VDSPAVAPQLAIHVVIDAAWRSVQWSHLTYAVESPELPAYLPVSRGVSMSRAVRPLPKEVACQTCRQAFSTWLSASSK